MPTTTARTEFLAGVRAEFPILLRVVSFGMIYGGVAIGAGLPGAPHRPCRRSSSPAPGNSSRRNSSPPARSPVPLRTTFIVNLRHMLDSVSSSPRCTNSRPAGNGWWPTCHG